MFLHSVQFGYFSLLSSKHSFTVNGQKSDFICLRWRNGTLPNERRVEQFFSSFLKLHAILVIREEVKNKTILATNMHTLATEICFAKTNIQPFHNSVYYWQSSICAPILFFFLLLLTMMIVVDVVEVAILSVTNRV